MLRLGFRHSRGSFSDLEMRLNSFFFKKFWTEFSQSVSNQRCGVQIAVCSS